MYWNVKNGAMNTWCKFGKDWLKSKGCEAHARKNAFGPLVATHSLKGDKNVLGSDAWSNEQETHGS